MQNPAARLPVLIRFVIRSSIHTPRTFTGKCAALAMRHGLAWNAPVCVGTGFMNYQPKTSEQDRSVKQI